VLEEGTRPQPLGPVPRVARLLALAHHFERLLAEGIVRTQGELAELAGVTRPRVTQILNLLLLAPDIQEELLFLPRPSVDRSLSPSAPCATCCARPCGASSGRGGPRSGMRRLTSHCDRCSVQCSDWQARRQNTETSKSRAQVALGARRCSGA
jgi:hypothetical protein